LERLSLWLDDVARSGPEAMAVDEWLLEGVGRPVLRVYRWRGNWGSIGCFGRMVEARAAFPELEWVRRWTGGGTVDHRHDWTYTLVLPASEALAWVRGPESYRVIHEALASALAAEGCGPRLAGCAPPQAGGPCFVHPVEHDVLDSQGGKIAGAGQRRNRAGLLHQGSVAMPQTDLACSAQRARCLASALAQSCEETAFHPPPEELRARAARRYGNAEWTNRR
jgi:lipoate-protein ligase A